MNFKAVHEKVKRFYCNSCSFGCYYQVNLEKHKRLKHSEEKTVNNNLSDSDILYEICMESDSDSKTNKEQKSGQNICKICNKTFRSSKYVQEHIESVHEKIKRFFCDMCDYRTYHDYHLRGHYQRVHSQELSSDLTKYSTDAMKKKIFFVLPRPKQGKWIVLLERL